MQIKPLVWQKKLVLTFADWPVSLQEIWLQVDLKQVASNSFYCVIYWKNMNPLSILHIRTWLNAEGDNSLKNTNFSKVVKFFLESCVLLHTWWRHPGGPSDCCGPPCSCELFHQNRCHQTAQYTQSRASSFLSSALCLHGRAAAHPFWSLNTLNHYFVNISVTTFHDKSKSWTC